jgi:peptidoglycan/LPS O-acetylase OafA/YrhL
LVRSPIQWASEWLDTLWVSPVTAKMLLSHLLMTGIGFNSIRLDGPIWSLFVEMRASIVFPLLVLFVRRLGWVGMAAAIVVALASVRIRDMIGDTPITHADGLVGGVLHTLYYIMFFCMGIMLAARLDQFRILIERTRPAFHGCAFVFMIISFVVFSYVPKEFVSKECIDIFIEISASYLIVYSMCSKLAIRMLLHPVFVWLGEVSFSLYLIHLPILISVYYLLGANASLVAVFLVAVPSMILAGEILHLAVERPSMALGRKWARRVSGAA